MKYTQEERVLILGSLFHDIGKFVQRCNLGRSYFSHPVEGKKFIDDNVNIKTTITSILGDEENYEKFCNIILYHHKPKNDIEQIVKSADHLSASERELLEKAEEPNEQWQHKFLSSIFSKIRLKSDSDIKAIYYNQDYLIKKNYKELIPAFSEYSNLKKYVEKDLENFRNDLEQIVSFYESEDDFSTIINLLLVLFEKYLWCIPDFTGNPDTDISLCKLCSKKLKGE